VYKRLYKFYGPQGWWPGRTRFEIMVGAILTQNTAWKNVEKAIANLRSSDLLVPSNMAKVSAKALAGLIRPAGYYNVKSKRLKNLIGSLSRRYGRYFLRRMALCETSDLREVLLNINGVGPETCDSILLYAFRKPVFVVDSYTRRILSRHALLKADSDYSEIQRFFMDALPADERMYNEYHALIVRLAKEFCRSTPRCGGCPVKSIA
jgi:endonuclease-3 related protein